MLYFVVVPVFKLLVVVNLMVTFLKLLFFKMNVPTMMMRLEVEEAPSNINFMAPVRSVDVELSRESLQAMVDGLGKIRDQLGQVAGR